MTAELIAQFRDRYFNHRELYLADPKSRAGEIHRKYMERLLAAIIYLQSR